MDGENNPKMNDLNDDILLLLNDYILWPETCALSSTCKRLHYLLVDEVGSKTITPRKKSTNIEVAKILNKWRIQSIDLSHCCINDTLAPLYMSCTLLQHINLSTLCITDKTVECISKCPLLKSIDCSISNITNESAMYLSVSKTIEDINLSGCDIDDYSIGPLSSCPMLRSLNLILCNITNKSLKILSTCSNLRILKLSMCEEISDLGVEWISSCQGLEFIDLSFCPHITDIGVTSLTKCYTLKHINLSHSRHISGTNVNGNFINLESIILCYCEKLRDTIIRTFSMCRTRSVDFSCCPHINDNTLRWLSQYPLQRIQCMECNITDKGVQYILQCPDLKSINFNNCPKITKYGEKLISDHILSHPEHNIVFERPYNIPNSIPSQRYWSILGYLMFFILIFYFYH